ncbi:MAG: hypothetical protein K8E24_014350 [Methanobacterium paludis]|nr:hypothetical protein [Methanobacterium paludis]
MVGTEMMDTQDRSLRVAYDLKEGLFVEQSGVTIKGSDTIMVNATADAGKMIVKGNMVKRSIDKDFTVEKCNTNDYLGYVIADPEGEPPSVEGMPLRRATVGHVAPGNDYHLNLKATNLACTPDSYIVWDGTGFDVSAVKVAGVVLRAKESANAGSGKFIDVYCEAIKATV